MAMKPVQQNSMTYEIGFEKRLNNEEHVRWFKGHHAIMLVKSEIEKFVDEISKTQYTALKKKLGSNTCQRRYKECKIYEQHQIDEPDLIDKRENKKKPCAVHIKWMKELFKKARTGVNYKNSWPKRWLTEHWELTKLFMGNYQAKSTDAASCDPRGLFCLMANNTEFISTQETIAHENMTKLVEMRDWLSHHPKQTIDQPQFEEYIEACLCFHKTKNWRTGRSDEVRTELLRIKTLTAKDIKEKEYTEWKKIERNTIENEFKERNQLIDSGMEEMRKSREMLYNYMVNFDDLKDLMCNVTTELYNVKEEVRNLNTEMHKNTTEVSEVKKEVANLCSVIQKREAYSTNDEVTIDDLVKHVREAYKLKETGWRTKNRVPGTNKIVDVFTEDLLEIDVTAKTLNRRKFNKDQSLEYVPFKPKDGRAPNFFERLSSSDIYHNAHGPYGPCRLLTVEGDAGIGKTVYSQQIVKSWVYDKGSNHKIIFHVHARELQPGLTLVDNLIHLQLVKQGHKAILEDTFNKWGCLVLFIIDGVDEIQIDKYAAVKDLLCGKTYSNTCKVATMRSLDLSNLAPTITLKLKPLSEQSIVKYIKQWFEFDTDDVANEFKNRFTKELLEVPLYLAMVCYICPQDKDEQSNRPVPQTQTELFNEYLRCQLHVWYGRDGRTSKTAQMFQSNFLANDSLVETSKKLVLIAIGELCIKRLVTDVYSFDKTDLDAFTLDRTLLVNSGLLIEDESKKGNLKFTHKTLQEYFSASYIVFDFEKMQHHTRIECLANMKAKPLFEAFLDFQQDENKSNTAHAFLQPLTMCFQFACGLSTMFCGRLFEILAGTPSVKIGSSMAKRFHFHFEVLLYLESSKTCKADKAVKTKMLKNFAVYISQITKRVQAKVDVKNISDAAVSPHDYADVLHDTFHYITELDKRYILDTCCQLEIKETNSTTLLRSTDNDTKPPVIHNPLTLLLLSSTRKTFTNSDITLEYKECPHQPKMFERIKADIFPSANFITPGISSDVASALVETEVDEYYEE